MSFSAVRGMLRCGLNTQDLGAELNLKPVLLLDLKEKYNLGNMEPRMELIIS